MRPDISPFVSSYTCIFLFSYIERVVLAELAARLYIIIHQHGEDGFGLLPSLDHQSFVRTHER
jgi:hypothetical protein